MVTRHKYKGVTKPNEHCAFVLDKDDLTTHESGWTIEGEVKDDGLLWVEEFTATHSLYGKVWGDYDEKLHADSKIGLKHFIKNHPPKLFDFWEI